VSVITLSESAPTNGDDYPHRGDGPVRTPYNS
jgi:hypothetical protein